MFELPKLQYHYNELEPFIDEKTMKIHHTKHHQAYVNNLNNSTKDTEMSKMTLPELMKKINENDFAVRNNGGGHYNHSFFWKILKKGDSAPSKELLDAINAQFGSIEAMKKEFEQAAATRFGSGWAWLIVKKSGDLAICSTPNQDNPLMPFSPIQGEPILGLDVWEHAYYLKYQNRRPEYVEAFWNIVDWQAVSQHYQNVLA